jgi:hypothetical protein
MILFNTFDFACSRELMLHPDFAPPYELDIHTLILLAHMVFDVAP